MKPFRIPFFALALGIALIFAFLLAGPVFAQDELPPAPAEPAAAETAPAVEEAAPAEEPLPAEEPPAVPVEEPLPVEDPPAVAVEEEAAPPVEEPAAETAPEIVALDEGGEVLPLASEAAAETVAGGDPYFKDGAIYLGWHDGSGCAPIVTTCTLSLLTSPLEAAWIAYGASPTATGPIYIEADTYSINSDLTIDPLLNANYADLTGLIGSGSGVVTVNFANNFHMIIQNMPAGFTLQGMTIIGNDTGSLVEFLNIAGNLVLTDVDINNTLDTDSDGLSINGVTGNVTLNTIKANGNNDEGAYITGVTGKVTVTNSSFDDNGAFGVGTGKHSLYIKSTGAISLNGVSSSDFNRGNGAYLKSLGGITVKNSLFNYNNDNNATDQTGYGLRIDEDSKGAILLDHVYSKYNQMAGIKVDTRVGGKVTMNTVEARYNRTGIEIENCYNGGTICTTTAGAVSLSNLTLENTYGNLTVTANGAITINSVTANWATNASGFGGIILDNQYAKTASAVTVNNTLSNRNDFAGIQIRSKGAVTLNHVTASSNSYGTAEGIDIVTSGTVTFLSTLGENEVEYNNSLGVSISASGAVSISKLTSNNNALTNLYIDNTAGSAGVTITTGDFSNSSGGSGLRILSDGAITLTDVDAQNNIQDGIYLDNQTGAKTGVTVKATGTNTNSVSNNQGDYGLFVNSKGAISVSGVYASGNDSRVGLDNAETGATAGITVNGLTSNTVNDTGDEAAVRIYSNGAVTVSNIDVEYSPDRGLYISNSTSTGTPGVTLKGVDLRYNTGGGMIVVSNGAVRITTIYAGNQFGGSGVQINTGGAVTIDKTPSAYRNEFSHNPGNGLSISAGGAVVIKDTNVNSNGGLGAGITGATSVSVTNSNFSYNAGGNGLDVSASGAITVSGSPAQMNINGYGMYLYNLSGTAGISVTGSSGGWQTFSSNNFGNLVLRTNGPLTLSYLESYSSIIALSTPDIVGNVTLRSLNFSNTSGDTISIDSNGTVSVTDVRTDSSSGNGLVINNSSGIGKTVTVTDFTDSSTTGSCALCITSTGAVTISDFDVDGGDLRDYGIWVDNSSGVKTGVTIKPLAWYQNEATNFQFAGVYIHSSGQVTLDQLYLNSSATGLQVITAGGVTITDSDASYCTTGMNLEAGGAVVLTNNTARYGTGQGVVIDNHLASPAAAVTITKLWVSNNDTGGLRINSAGAVTITDLDAGEQEVSGYALEIDTSGTVTMNSAGLYSWGWNDLSSGYLSASGGTIHAGGNVSLTGIYASNNAGGSGLTVVSDNGSVTIKNAEFRDNNVNGLSVTAKGNITLTSVDATGNDTGYGAVLDNFTAGTGGVTVSGTISDWNLFNNNATVGLGLYTLGPVTLNYIRVDNVPIGIQFPSSGNRVGSVSMNYVEVTDTVNSYGILFESNGTVTLSNIYIDNNGLGGLKIDNSFATSPKNVTLTNITSTGGAGDYGLYVRSLGAITTKYLRASGTGGRQYGIWLDNRETGATAGVTMTVNTSDYWNYSNNFTNYGLNIESNGAVSVSYYYSSNTRSGLRIENRAAGNGAVTLNNINSYNNTNEGVFIRTNGNTALSNMQVYQNGGALQNGIDIQVDGNGTVSLTNITAYSNRNHEIQVVSHRQITAKLLTVYDYTGVDTGSAVVLTTDGGGVSILDPVLKDYYGDTVWNTMPESNQTALVINASGDVVLQRVSVNSSDAGHGIQMITDGKVTLTNIFTASNFLDGLNVDAGGSISLTSVEARQNSIHGAFLVNDHPGSTGGVTVNTSIFYSNYGASPNAGLVVRTNGAVLFNQVDASNNSGFGAYVTVTDPSTASVTINKSVFTSNDGDDGLFVQNRGNITLNGVTASDNSAVSANGISLDNHLGTGTVSVLATLGANTFFYNRLHGLAILSSNAVVIINVTANENRDGTGIGVNTTTAAAGLGTVTITGVVVKLNEIAGIAINSNGSVTLSSIECISNGLGGGGSAGIDISTTGGYNVLVQNSLVSGNGKEGIRANLIAGKTLTVKKTFYMGNGRTVIGSKNLDPVSGTLIIVL